MKCLSQMVIHLNAVRFSSSHISLMGFDSEQDAWELLGDSCLREQGKKNRRQWRDAFACRDSCLSRWDLIPWPHCPSFFLWFVVCPREQPGPGASSHSHHGVQPKPRHRRGRQHRRPSLHGTGLSWPASPCWRCSSGWSCWDCLWSWNLAWPILSCPCSTGCMWGCEAPRRRCRGRKVPTRCSTRAARQSREAWPPSSWSVSCTWGLCRGDRTRPAVAPQGPRTPWLWLRTACGSVNCDPTIPHFPWPPATVLSQNFFFILVKLLERHSLWVWCNL